MRITLDMAGVTCLEFIPPKRGEDAIIEIWEGDHLTGRVEIGPDNVSWWRHLFAQGLGLCESVERTGLEVIFPTEQVSPRP